MLGYIRTSDTSQAGLRCPCTPHPAFWVKKLNFYKLIPEPMDGQGPPIRPRYQLTRGLTMFTMKKML